MVARSHIKFTADHKSDDVYFSADELDDDFERPYRTASISAHVAPTERELIKYYAAQRGYSSVSEFVRSLVEAEMKRNPLDMTETEHMAERSRKAWQKFFIRSRLQRFGVIDRGPLW